MNRFIQNYSGCNPLEKYYDYTKCAIVSIEKAIVHVTTVHNQLDVYAKNAKSKCHRFTNNEMSKDEAAAIYLYTMDWGKQSLHFLLNHVLFIGEYEYVKDWFHFLKLFNSALAKLPPIRGKVWRGMQESAAMYLRVGDEITWWTFSSCSDSQHFIRELLDQTSSLCSITTLNGRRIHNYAVNTTEEEVLLLPGTYLRVKEKRRDQDTGRFILHLEEIDNNYLKETESISTYNAHTTDPYKSVLDSASSKTLYTSEAHLTLQDPQANKDVHKSRKEFIMSVTTFQNEDRYEVAYKDGEKYGTSSYFDGITELKGPWADKKAVGKGIRIWQNGDRYEGNINNGRMSGFGILVCANGHKYEGNWIADKASGQGITTFPDGTCCEGIHKNGKIEGYGTFLSSNGDQYQGGLLENKAHGRGVRIWKTGDRYEGEFSNDKKHGHGIYRYANSGTYDGSWQNDEMNGYGILIWPSGTKYKGNFQNGKRHGQGKLVFSNGSVQDGLWQNDVFKS